MLALRTLHNPNQGSSAVVEYYLFRILQPHHTISMYDLPTIYIIRHIHYVAGIGHKQ